MFPPDLLQRAQELLHRCRHHSATLVTAESCTGGLIAALLTEIPGSSDVVERGFVTYSNAAKRECLGVSAELLDQHGAVSAEVARAMARGALEYSHASVSIAVTGVAGPGGGTSAKPVGLVYVAAAAVTRDTRVEAFNFDASLGRDGIRRATLEQALRLAGAML